MIIAKYFVYCIQNSYCIAVRWCSKETNITTFQGLDLRVFRAPPLISPLCFLNLRYTLPIVYPT